VGCRPAARGAQAGQTGRIEGEKLRRKEIIGHHDRTRGDAGRGRFDAENPGDHLALQIQQVVGPLGHAGIADRPEDVRRPARGLTPGVAGAPPLADGPAGVGDEGGVVEKAEVGGQYRPPVHVS
jgi:hypothetical protein